MIGFFFVVLMFIGISGIIHYRKEHKFIKQQLKELDDINEEFKENIKKNPLQAEEIAERRFEQLKQKLDNRYGNVQ